MAELAGLLLGGDLDQAFENLSGSQPLFFWKHAKHNNTQSAIGETFIAAPIQRVALGPSHGTLLG